MQSDLSLRYVLAVPSRRTDREEMPMVVMIHGRGADANDLADLAPMLDLPEGCRFVFPNAPRPFEAYPGMTFGWTWFDGWPPLLDSVAGSRKELLHFVTEVSAKYPTSRLVIAGFSQGGMMSLDIGLRVGPSLPLAGIIAMSGGLFEEDLDDLRAGNHPPVLITHGSQDDVVPVVFAQRARSVLEGAGLDVEYHEYAMGHQVVPEEVGVVKAFLKRVLAP